MDQFQKFDGKNKIPNVNQYIKDWLNNNPNGTIAIGTDSIQKKKYVTYAIVIALFYDGNKGAHLIYKNFKEKNNSKLPLFNRLWNEVMYTYDTLELLKREVGVIAIPHIDINVDEDAGSNIAYQAAMGFFKSQGYDVVGKPMAWVASCAADCRCNN